MSEQVARGPSALQVATGPYETLSLRQLRERLKEHGITVRKFAAVSGVSEGQLSTLLNGRGYLGPVRRARIEGAITRLRLDQELCQAQEPTEVPVFRVRKL